MSPPVPLTSHTSSCACCRMAALLVRLPLPNHSPCRDRRSRLLRPLALHAPYDRGTPRSKTQNSRPPSFPAPVAGRARPLLAHQRDVSGRRRTDFIRRPSSFGNGGASLAALFKFTNLPYQISCSTALVLSAKSVRIPTLTGLRKCAEFLLGF